MAKLTDPQKLFLIKALACFDSPTRVATAFREEYGVEVGRAQVAKYDPTKAGGGEVSAKLRAVFDETRKTFLSTAGDVPIANKSVRLRALNRMFLKAEEQGNMVLAGQFLEQAAKEAGNAFTNRRELTGANGGPIKQTAELPSLSSLTTMSDEELEAMIRRVADSV